MTDFSVEGKNGCRTLKKPSISFFFDLSLIKVSHLYTQIQMPANQIFPPTGWKK